MRECLASLRATSRSDLAKRPQASKPIAYYIARKALCQADFRAIGTRRHPCFSVRERAFGIGFRFLLNARCTRLVGGFLDRFRHAFERTFEHLVDPLDRDDLEAVLHV